MDSNSNLSNDVLHSDNHNKLSAEEIAKAVARHNKNHPAGSKAAPAAKRQPSGKK